VTAAVVPVKSFAAAKSRLAAALGRAGAESLALAMLEDVVAALRAVPRLAAVAVTSCDPAVARAAERAGAQALLEPERSEGDLRARGERSEPERSEGDLRARGERSEPGLNEAVERAGAQLGDACRGGLLVVLGDVAGVRPEEIEQVLDALAGMGAPGVVLVPARDGGSAALARNPRDAIPARFGPDSARAHREAARRAGVPLVELAPAGLSLDLDDAESLRAFLAGPGDGPRTRAVLRALGAAGPT
jgi:2-phospho-L-lactate guanylyltransferase